MCPSDGLGLLLALEHGHFAKAFASHVGDGLPARPVYFTHLGLVLRVQLLRLVPRVKGELVAPVESVWVSLYLDLGLSYLEGVMLLVLGLEEASGADDCVPEL